MKSYLLQDLKGVACVLLLFNAVAFLGYEIQNFFYNSAIHSPIWLKHYTYDKITNLNKYTCKVEVKAIVPPTGTFVAVTGVEWTQVQHKWTRFLVSLLTKMQLWAQLTRRSSKAEQVIAAGFIPWSLICQASKLAEYQPGRRGVPRTRESSWGLWVHSKLNECGGREEAQTHC